MTESHPDGTNSEEEVPADAYERVKDVLISLEEWTPIDHIADDAGVEIETARSILTDLKSEGVAWMSYSGIAQVDEDWLRRQEAKELAKDRTKDELMQELVDLIEREQVLRQAIWHLD